MSVMGFGGTSFEKTRRRRLHFATSEWQRSTLIEGFLCTILIIALFGFAISLSHGILNAAYNVNDEGQSLFAEAFSVLFPFHQNSVSIPFLDIRLPYAEFFVALVCGIVMLIVGVVFWHVYRAGNEIKEVPVERCVEGEWAPYWLSVFSEDKFNSKNKENDQQVWREQVAFYEDEFFLNALVNPRSVFSRISEHIIPGRRLMECTTEYEITVPKKHGLQIVGLNDLSVKAAGDEFTSGFLMVPVSFQKRGSLTILQEVKNTAGRVFPIIRNEKVAKHLLHIIEDRLREECHRNGPSADDIKRYEYWENHLKHALKEYLLNVKPNASIDVALEVGELLSCYSSDLKGEHFCDAMTRALVGMKDVVPTCVSMHVALIKTSKRDDDSDESNAETTREKVLPQRTFTIFLQEEREMDVKPTNIFPNRNNNMVIGLINRVMRRTSKRGDTIFYNLARAGRSRSYHLYVKGPEDTYYARGSLLRQDTSDRRRIYAEHVEVQKRYGQRQAHIYVRSGHRMSNVTFMFRYRKAPLDTYHIMFVAVLLCTAVLIVCAISALANQGMSSLSVATMLLAVITAAGPWIYGRASDGRDASWGIEASMIVMIFCAAIGMILFFWMLTTYGITIDEGIGSTASKLEGAALRWAIFAWSALIAIMAADSAIIGYIAMLHSSVYHYLLSKGDKDGDAATLGHGDAYLLEETEDGVRLDTPQGRVVRNPYAMWTASQLELRRRCGIDE